MRRPMLWLVTAALAITPAAAQQSRYLNPQDVAQAQREHAQMLQELGGAETGPRAAYVESVGRKVGAYSGLAAPGQQLHFITLNSAVENAFSVPGGYVYVTRQLLGLMNDESELAFALGHEVGHIAANHAHIREAYARRNPMGVFGQILGAVFGQSVFANQIAARAKLDTLPDGAIISLEGQAFAVQGNRLLRWTPEGYSECRPRPKGITIDALTPPSILSVLRRGYGPLWHPSATR